MHRRERKQKKNHQIFIYEIVSVRLQECLKTDLRVLGSNTWNRPFPSSLVPLFQSESKAKFRRRTSHEPNRMQMRKILCSLSLAFDSAQVKYGV